MSTVILTHPLIDALWPPAERGVGMTRSVLLVLAGTVLLALSARLQIPFWPVPMTMQTFAVLVIAMAYGARLGTATVGVYLLQGAMGLPVFASGVGLAYFAGPTGGYLLGFLLAAWLVGGLAERGWDRRVGPTLLAMVLGTLVILVCGVSWLAVFMQQTGTGGAAEALATGVLPFLPAAVFKVALAAAVLPGVWRLLGRR